MHDHEFRPRLRQVPRIRQIELRGSDLTRAAPDADRFLRADVRIGAESLALPEVGSSAAPPTAALRCRPPTTTPTLVRFDRPLTAALQRFLEHASELRIPAADETRFAQAYYPRLLRRRTYDRGGQRLGVPAGAGARLSRREMARAILAGV